MHISLDKNSAVPYYVQVKEGVKSLIAGGQLKPGDMLTTEFNLSGQLGISRLVVHRAYRELVTEGLLIRKRAKGTFVSPPSHRSYTVVGPLFSVTENMARVGLKPSNKILTQEVIPASEEVRGELRLEQTARVIHLYNVRLVDQLPFSVEDMYFPAERFPKLANMDLDNRSVYATLEKLYDAHPQEALDIVSAGSATREEARLLGINKGAPVMRLRRTSLDRDGLAVEYSKVVFHAGRYQFVARVQRES
jgi:GntR family transcriptional regulator, N-acetylglucosamine utilization regulator